MKKILIFTIITIFNLFGYSTNASSIQNKVDTVLNGFYQKLDKSIQDNNKKVIAIEKILKKVQIIKDKQLNNLKTNDKILITRITKLIIA